MRGQLLPEERKFLYNSIITIKPNLVLEIGTWRGGGSTYQIAEALLFNNSGKLVTCETNTDFYREALSIYDCDKWNDIVDCRNVNSSVLIKELIDKGDIPDFLFFDGPEDPESNLEDFLHLEQYLSDDSYFCAHDWDLGTRIDGLKSIKSKLIRPYVENSDKWIIIKSLSYPVSVGIVLARYKL